MFKAYILDDLREDGQEWQNEINKMLQWSTGVDLSQILGGQTNILGEKCGKKW